MAATDPGQDECGVKVMRRPAGPPGPGSAAPSTEAIVSLPSGSFQAPGAYCNGGLGGSGYICDVLCRSVRWRIGSGGGNQVRWHRAKVVEMRDDQGNGSGQRPEEPGPESNAPGQDQFAGGEIFGDADPSPADPSPADPSPADPSPADRQP